MRRVLAAAVLMALLPSAHAQDKGKSDFSTNAEYRARWFLMKNPTFDTTSVSSKTMAEQRFKVGLNYKASEKMSAHATLLHNSNFGTDNNDDPAASSMGAGTTDGGDNLLSVNEAYVNWMTADDLHFKVGRMNYTVGDGTLISANDWEKVPYSFEGVLGTWEQEWGKIQLALFKVRNLVTTSNNHPATGSSASASPQHNMYGLNFDLKTMPEWLKAVNAHVFKDSSDAIVDGTHPAKTVMGPNTDGLNTMRYGLMAGFGFGPVDLKAWWEGQGGKINHLAANGDKTENDYQGDMMQLEVGYNLPSFMMSRFWFQYHKDSGDSDLADTKYKGYDSYYTEKHYAAGQMDLFGWGNLTDINVGWTLKPTDKTDVGLAYHMFKRTESKAGAQSFTSGIYGGSLPTANGTAANDKAGLGDEIDVWATHGYGAGLSTTALVGYFMPGDYFTDSATNNRKDKALFLMLEGKATF